MNRTRKNIATNVIPIHQFFFSLKCFGFRVVVAGTDDEVGTDSDCMDIFICARFRIGFTLDWLEP